MTLNIEDAELRVYRVINDSEERDDADLIIPGARDQQSVSGLKGNAQISKNVNDWIDEASFDFRPFGGMHGHEMITSGDRLEFVIETPGGYEDTRWTGWSYSPDWEMMGSGRVDWSVKAGDFVFETLKNRDVFQVFNDRRVAVDESEEEYTWRDGILNNILHSYCPEIDRSGIETLDAVTDYMVSGETALQAFEYLTGVADAVMYSEGTQIKIYPMDGLPTQFELDYDDFKTGAGGRDDDALRNRWRVDGGTGRSEDERTMDDEEDPVAYREVNENNPITFQLDPEKDRLIGMKIWTRKNQESASDIRIRIQKGNSDNTGPRDHEDTTKDIESFTIANDFISLDDWWRGIRFDREPLSANVWLIIDTNDPEVPHDIGLASTNPDVPAIVTEYPYSIAVDIPERMSVLEYRRRDGHVRRDVETNREARDIANAANRHNAWPENYANFVADSERMHRLIPGELISIDMPEVGMSGDFLVMQRQDEYRDIRIDTTVTVQDIQTV